MALLTLLLSGVLAYADSNRATTIRGDGGALQNEIDSDGLESSAGPRSDSASVGGQGGSLEDLLASASSREAARRFSALAEREPAAAFLVLAQDKPANLKFADKLLTFERGRGRDFRHSIVALNRVRTFNAGNDDGSDVRRTAQMLININWFDRIVSWRLKRQLIALSPVDYANAMDDIHAVVDILNPRFRHKLSSAVVKASNERCQNSMRARD